MDGILSATSGLEPFQKWALIIAAVLTIVYAVMRPMRRKKDPLAAKRPVSLAGQREIEKQMTDLIVELEKMARQMTAQLDTRAARLEMLLREADERIESLRGLGQAGGESRKLRLVSAPQNQRVRVRTFARPASCGDIRIGTKWAFGPPDCPAIGPSLRRGGADPGAAGAPAGRTSIYRKLMF